MSDGASGWVRRHRAQLAAGGGALILVGAVAVGIFGAGLRAEAPTGATPSIASPVPNIGSPPASMPTNAEPQEWIDDLPVGAPPLVPYAHDGNLYVGGVRIETPFPVHTIEVAGDTVMIGDRPSTFTMPTQWALVREGRVEPLPASTTFYPRLSTDGRIAYWQTNPTFDTTQFVMWDAETNQELATQTVHGRFDGANRLHVIGVDADGIAHWVDQASSVPVMRWDVRADVVEPTDIRYDARRTLDDQSAPLGDLWVGLEDAYVSPDGTRTVFTGARADEPPGCCKARLQVKTVGQSGAVAPGDVTVLQLPDGIPSMRLWEASSDRGIWGVWWESNETVLLDAIVDGHSYLVRCWATGGACELVFDLGANTSEGRLYMPDWEHEWAFGRFPLGG